MAEEKEKDKLEAAVQAVKDLVGVERELEQQIKDLKAKRDARLAAEDMTVKEDRKMAEAITTLAQKAHQVRDFLAAARGTAAPEEAAAAAGGQTTASEEKPS